jgi:hypothetical protein
MIDPPRVLVSCLSAYALLLLAQHDKIMHAAVLELWVNRH